MEIQPQATSSKEKKSENSKLIVVILVGAQGSGKSTFCELVMQSSNRPWTRICQDTIGNGGKNGTRKECLMGAATALKDGSSVLIDRCNIDREQRSEFLKLGGDEVEKHCVILDLPAKVCISRVAKRKDHEGNLQGGKAAAAVNRTLQKKELPKLSEGFSRIMYCSNEENAEAAVGTYRKLGSVDTLPSGYFGQKKPDSKIQVGIRRFLKKLDPPANIQSKSDGPQQMSQDNVSVCKADKNSPARSGVKNDVLQRKAQHEVSVEEIGVSKPEEISPADSDVRSDVPRDLAPDEVSVEKCQFVSKNEEIKPTDSDVRNHAPHHSDVALDELSVKNCQFVSKNEEINPTDSDMRNHAPHDLDVALDEGSVKKVSVFKEEDSCSDHSDVRNDEKSDSGNETSSTENVSTLAFPSISTADFQFDLEHASSIIVATVEEYIDKIGKARLVLVDISRNSKILASVRRKLSQRNIDPSKFSTFVGDITKLHTKGGLQCNVIANATNWQLKPEGGGVNAAIFNAAGPEFERATKEIAKSIQPGNAVIVPVPSTSSLCIREGVTHVVHVLGPNMNPHRPDCLNNDYIKGRSLLHKAYSSLFEGFISILGLKETSTVNIDNSPERQYGLHGSPVNDGYKVRRREGLDQPGNSKRCKGFYKEFGTEDFYAGRKQETPKSKETKGTGKTWGSYAQQALYNMAMHPDRYKNEVIEVSDDVVVINDLYPKAQKHLLVVARAEGLDSLADVDEDHLALLNRMHRVGLKHAENLLKDNESLIFRLGYHSVPSMRQLHLHVISQDFDSKHLKNKKHWNSFNTPFFLDSVDVIENVSENGKPVLVDDESFLKKELRCHRCRSAHPNIPRLKSHVTSCQAPFPSALQQNSRLIIGLR